MEIALAVEEEALQRIRLREIGYLHLDANTDLGGVEVKEERKRTDEATVEAENAISDWRDKVGEWRIWSENG